MDELIKRFGPPKDAFKEELKPNAHPFLDNLRTLHKQQFPDSAFRVFAPLIVGLLANRAIAEWNNSFFSRKKARQLQEKIDTYMPSALGEYHLIPILQYLADNHPQLETWTTNPDSKLISEIQEYLLNTARNKN